MNEIYSYRQETWSILKLHIRVSYMSWINYSLYIIFSFFLAFYSGFLVCCLWPWIFKFIFLYHYLAMCITHPLSLLALTSYCRSLSLPHPFLSLSLYLFSLSLFHFPFILYIFTTTQNNLWYACVAEVGVYLTDRKSIWSIEIFCIGLTRWVLTPYQRSTMIQTRAFW